MNSEIIVALFSLLGTAIGTFGGMQLTKYRISQLEKKVISAGYNLDNLSIILIFTTDNIYTVFL